MGKKNDKNENSFLNKEFGGMMLTFVCAFLFFSMVTGDAVFHPLGDDVRKFLLGVIGYFGYPLLLAGTIGGVMLIIGKGVVRGKGTTKAVALVIFTIAVFVILQLASSDFDDNLGDYLGVCYNAPAKGVSYSTPGGVLFGFIAYGLKTCLSVAGAYIFCALLATSCLFVVFGELIFRVKNKSSVDESIANVSREDTQSSQTEVKEEHYAHSFVRNSSPRSKITVVGDRNFEMKSASDYSAIDARKKREEILGGESTFQNSPYSSVYSEVYNKEYAEKLDYVKTPRRINPDGKVGDYNNANFVDASYRTNVFDNDESAESDPISSDVYIPENFKEAVKKTERDCDDVFSSDIEKEIESEIMGNENGSASDSEIVDIPEDGFSPSHREVRPSSPIIDEPVKPRDVGYTPRVERPKTVEPINARGEQSQASDNGADVNPYDQMPLDFKYNPPPLDLFKTYKSVEDYGKIEYFKQEKATKIMNTLKVLGGVNVRVVNIVHGPTITRFDLAIPDDVSIKNIMKYADDLKLRLETASEIRFATIPKTPFIGVEVPNDVKTTVGLRDVLESEVFTKAKSSSLTFAIGKDIVGNPVVADITKMPHLLIAGSTGTGKSVGLNSLLVSLMYKYSPQELRFIIVDPKQVEFTIFEGIPHMYFDEILCDAPKTVAMLNWAVKEMDDRYTKLKNAVVRNIDEYNDQIDPRKERKMPRIVIIIDEFADLMSVEKKNIEDKIARIAQKARAAGMYLILATQRPDVKIIEGSIKTNFTSRMAFKMSNAVDSTTILGEAGAEKLLGAGDLLYKTSTMTNVERAQGAFISTEEIKSVVKYIKDHNRSYFNDAALRTISKASAPQVENINGKESSGSSDGGVPEDYITALKVAVQIGTISISLLQRKLSFGYPKAAKIVDWMTDEGYVVTSQAGKQKQVTLTMDEFIEKFGDV